MGSVAWADLLEPRHDVILTREEVRLQSLINEAREEGQVTIDMPFKETAACHPKRFLTAE